MRKFVEFLERVIENNSNFMEVCDAEQAENPGAKFPYKKYFTSLGEIQLAKRILIAINRSKIPKTYKEVILNEICGWKLRCVERIEVYDKSPERYHMLYDNTSGNINDFLNRLNFIDDINYPRYRITIWVRGNFWYEVTPIKLIRNKKTPKYEL